MLKTILKTYILAAAFTLAWMHGNDTGRAVYRPFKTQVGNYMLHDGVLYSVEAVNDGRKATGKQ